METQRRAGVAEQFLAAYSTRVPLPPLTQTFPDVTLDDAYGIQVHQLERRLGTGRTLVGHKVGLTSVAMQRLLGVDQPDYGHLLDDFVREEGTPIPADEFIQPRVEPEIAFVLQRALKGPGVTVADAAAAVGSVLPSLELVDSRIRDWEIGLLDTIADNASSGAVVLGAARRPLTGLDLAGVGCVLEKNGQVVGRGDGAAVMGDPLNALVWLANTLGQRGVALEAGQLVLPGAVCAMVPVAAGDVFTATFDGLGSVIARFA